MTKTKVWINIACCLLFALILVVVCQFIILKNIDIFGDETTGGGFIPYGFSVKLNVCLCSVIGIIASIIIWRIKKLNIKLIPLLLVSIILPSVIYSANYNYFYGEGEELREKLVILHTLNEREDKVKNSNRVIVDENLNKYTIYLTEQKNDDFYAYLYAEESFEYLYFFMKLSPDAKTSACGLFACSLDYVYNQSLKEYLVQQYGADYSNSKTININKYGVEKIDIYSNCAILTYEDSTQIYYVCEDFKWLL